MKVKYSVTLPDGTVATQASTRTYTHAIAVFSTKHNETEPRWRVRSWAGRPDLAEKRVAEFASRPDIWTKVHAIPVDVIA